MAVFFKFEEITDSQHDFQTQPTPIRAALASPKRTLTTYFDRLCDLDLNPVILSAYSESPPEDAIIRSKFLFFRGKNFHVEHYIDSDDVDGVILAYCKENKKNSAAVFFTDDRTSEKTLNNTHSTSPILRLPLNEQGVDFFCKHADKLGKSSCDELFYKDSFSFSCYLLGFLQIVSVVGVFVGLYRVFSEQSFFYKDRETTPFYSDYISLISGPA